MLVKDPKKWIIAYEVLRHPWIHDGAAPDKPLDSAVLSRLKQFTAMNKLKKMALKLNMSKLVLVLVELQRLDCKDLVLISMKLKFMTLCNQCNQQMLITVAQLTMENS